MTDFTSLYAADGWLRVFLWELPLAVVCVWCAAACLAHRPQWRSWLWRMGILKCGLCMVLPVSLAVPLLQRDSSIEPTALIASAAPVRQFAVEPIDETPAEPMRASLPPEPAPALSREPIFPNVTLFGVLAGLWLLGVVAVVAVWLRRWFQVQRLFRDAGPTSDPRLRAMVGELSRRQRLKHPPRVAITAETVSPLVIGWWRPRIIVPAWLLAAEHEQELHMALAHELAHVRRQDLFWNLLGAVVGGVCFFHPLVWFALRRLRIAQESAADELALRTTATPPADYARILVQIAEAARGRPALHPSLLTASRSYLDLSERIRILNAAQHPRRAGALALLAVPLILLVGIVPWHPIAQRSEIAAAEPQVETTAAAQEVSAEIEPISAKRNAEIDAAVKRLKDLGIDVKEYGPRGHKNHSVVINTSKSGGAFAFENVEIMGRGVNLSLSLVNVKFSPDELKRMASVKWLFGLELSGESVTDDVLAVLPELLSQDCSLILGDGPYTAAGMEHVAACAGLRNIRFNGKSHTNEYLAPLAGMTNLEEVSLQSPGFTPRALELLSRLPGLKTLRMFYQRVPPRRGEESRDPLKLMPEHIAGLGKLQTISLFGEHQDDATARALAEHCPELEVIDINRSSITTAGARELAKLPKLRILELHGAPLDDGIADAFRQMKRVERLQLSGCGVGDETLAALAECPELRELGISRAKVTDDGVQHLLKMPRLMSVGLGMNKGVTDESLDVFRRLPNVDQKGFSIGLGGTSISEEGMLALEQSLPNARVGHSFPK